MVEQSSARSKSQNNDFHWIGEYSLYSLRFGQTRYLLPVLVPSCVLGVWHDASTERGPITTILFFCISTLEQLEPAARIISVDMGVLFLNP